jgi:hypothetical protein
MDTVAVVLRGKAILLDDALSCVEAYLYVGSAHSIFRPGLGTLSVDLIRYSSLSQS